MEEVVAADSTKKRNDADTKNHLELLYIKGNVNFATLDE
jgi:hypothetical protein